MAKQKASATQKVEPGEFLSRSPEDWDRLSTVTPDVIERARAKVRAALRDSLKNLPDAIQDDEAGLNA